MLYCSLIKRFLAKRFSTRVNSGRNLLVKPRQLASTLNIHPCSDVSFDLKNFVEISQCLHQLPYLHTFLPAKESFLTESLVTLSNAELVGCYGTVWCNGKYSLQSCLGNPEYLTSKNDIKALLMRRFYPVSNRVSLATSLVNCLCLNYCHFVLDVLPSIQTFFDQHGVYDRSIRLIIHPDSPLFVYQWLAILGVPLSCIVKMSGSRVVVDQYLLPPQHFSRVLYPEVGCSLPIYSPSALCFLREKALASLRVGIHHNRAAPNRRKIFINRRSPCNRRILNEQPFLNLVKSFGYEQHFLDGLTVLEQLVLVNTASHIIAIHGAGLANLIVAQSCCLIELYPSSKPDGLLYFFQLSNLFCSKHIRLICPDDSLQNMYVDPSRLSSLLETV